MEARRSFALNAVILVLGMYGLVAGLAATYFNWQYARTEGFVQWLRFGEIVSTAKGLVWPYYAFRAKQSDKPFRDWSPEDLANSKHFLISIQADLQSLELSRTGTSRNLNSSEVREILALKESALREAHLVHASVLKKIHPELPEHFGTQYVRGLELRIRHFSTPGGDISAERDGIALLDSWADWFNSRREDMVLPK